MYHRAMATYHAHVAMVFGVVKRVLVGRPVQSDKLGHTLLPKKIAVNLLIAVFKENRFSTIATLRHVVRQTGYHHAGQTRHERKLTTNQNRGK